MAVCLLSVTVTNAAPSPSKHIVLIYKVPDTILMCQNSNEDMVAGAHEFETELKNHYGNRFIVDSVKHLPLEPKLGTDEYLAMVKPNQTPFILTLDLLGSGAQTVTYQNAFGATISSNIPTIKVKRDEYIVDRKDMAIYNVSYPVVEYSPNTMAVGREIVSNTDIRKNTKNAVRGCIRDGCAYQGDKINKYADPANYSTYMETYTGNFKQFDQKQVISSTTRPYLGIYSKALMISTVEPNGPMGKAGAQVNDVIVEIDGQNVYSQQDILAILNQHKPNDVLNFKVVRNGTLVNLVVKTEKRTMTNFKNIKV